MTDLKHGGFLAIAEYLLLLTLASPGSGQGYHAAVGIPAARNIYLAETTTTTPGAKLRASWHADMAAHAYLVGVVVGMHDAYSVCGAAILTNTRALTAAHCWFDGWRQAREFTLVFASEYMFVGGLRKLTRRVSMHPSWDPDTLIHNLAVIRFERVEYTSYIQPIALPTTLVNVDLFDYWVQACSYSMAPSGTENTENQKQTVVFLKVIHSKQCVGSDQALQLRTVCAIQTEPDTCISHAGGPLSVVYNNERYLVGVASFGDYNCSTNDASGFVRVTYYLKWIFQNLV